MKTNRLTEWAISQREGIKKAVRGNYDIKASLSDFLSDAPYTMVELGALEQALVCDPAIFDDECICMVTQTKAADAEEVRSHWDHEYGVNR